MTLEAKRGGILTRLLVAPMAYPKMLTPAGLIYRQQAIQQIKYMAIFAATFSIALTMMTLVKKAM
jgi:ABC-type transport system involved in cytochrome c biogenesis permease component